MAPDLFTDPLDDLIERRAREHAAAIQLHAALARKRTNLAFDRLISSLNRSIAQRRRFLRIKQLQEKHA